MDALAALLEGFLLGISPMARDGVELAVIEGAIDQAVKLWDINARKSESHHQA